MNYAFKQPPRVRAGTVFDSVNFCQRKPGTILKKFDKKLTFKNCNLKNVKISPKWTVEGCNTQQEAVRPKPSKARMAELEMAAAVRLKAKAEARILRLGGGA